MASELSDSQLRKELVAHGQKSIGLITETTRALYVKKLDKLIADKKKGTGNLKASSRSRGRASTGSAPVAVVPIPASSTAKVPDRKLFGFSSDDDSDKEAKAKAVKAKSRNNRNTRSSGRFPAKEEQQVAEEEEESEGENQNARATNTFARPSLRRRSTPVWISQSLQDSGSRSTQSHSYTRPNPKTNRNEPRQTSMSRFVPKVRPSSFQDETEDQDSNMDEFSDSDLDEQLVDMTSKGFNTSSFLDTSQHNSGYERPKSSRRSVPNSVYRDTEDVEEPSVVVPRKMQRKNKTGTDHVNLTDDENLLQQHFKTKEDKNRYKWALYVSKLLLLTAAVFFVILALMYVNIRGILPMFNFTQSDTGEQNVLDHIVCHGEICQEKSKKKPAIELADKIYDHLSHVAGMYDCGFSSERKLSFVQMKQHLLEIYKHDLDSNGKEKDRKYSLKLALQLILDNPEWKIKLYDKDMKDIEEISEGVEFLESEDADMSLWCRIRKSVERLIYYIICFIVVVIVVVLCVTYYKYRTRQNEEEMKKVYELVERIIDKLKQHHDRCQSHSGEGHDSYMAIVHVRDMLIPIKQRRKMTPLWNKAVHFLAANESRIRTEMQTIKGEEFEVWRWLSPSANGGKVWQGQAFGENHESGFNLLPFTPTPCLKIRNMFDNDVECSSNWHVRIQDAILEKCGVNHNVVHIAVDRSSKEGCVYVKCGSPDGAGRAYRALHGWWFDGNLVTVKFLRLERYHERFPGATSENTPLKPSNTDRLSLSQPYHRSVLELS